MQYMIIERFKNQDPKPVYLRFREHGRLMPDGLRYIHSWVDNDFTQCFQLMECDDERLLQEWISHWKDLVDFEVISVRSSQEAAKIIAPLLDITNSTKIDASLVEHNLRLSPEERIDSHEATRQLVKDLQNAGKTHYEGQS